MEPEPGNHLLLRPSYSARNFDQPQLFRRQCRLLRTARQRTGQNGTAPAASAQHNRQRPTASGAVSVPVAQHRTVPSIFVSLHVDGFLFRLFFHFFRLPRSNVARIPVHLISNRWAWFDSITELGSIRHFIPSPALESIDRLNRFHSVKSKLEINQPNDPIESRIIWSGEWIHSYFKWASSIFQLISNGN